jgi:alkylation response protein AidB-like acyl-CoA dehydrogenase
MTAPATTSSGPLLRGGAWLIEPSDPAGVFSPERLTEEHRLIRQTVSDFIDHEVLPVLERLEQKDWTLAQHLIRRCGELGLLGIEVAEEHGGLQLDKATSVVVSGQMSRAASFGATFGVQVNLVILAVSLFGTDEQKRKYLPRLVSGELIGAYCLSEPGSGSDALGARTRAARQADGTFVLSGEKAWTTNGGFADVFIVFAKVDGEHFSAFIVERAFGGVTSGKEERKMGLHGSSTTAIVLQDVPVPAGNLLGEIGKGHKIAFNVLNFARFKLGATCAGGARDAVAESSRYAAERKQFGQPIASFGAIKHKIGEMVARTYAVESLVYRTAGLLDARIESLGHAPGDPASALASFEEYAVEASIAKVAGSEALDFVLDENIQIHGGNGFVADYPAERHYRDSRVNRIFEGTNEINRLLIPGILAKRAVKGDLPIIAAAKALQDELLGPPSLAASGDGALGSDRMAVDAFKKVALMVFGLAMQTFGARLSDEQEVLMHTADIMMDVYAAESAVLRAAAADQQQVPNASRHVDAARICVDAAAIRIDGFARQALGATVDGDMLRVALAGLRRLLKVTPINSAALRRHVADETVARGGYPL